MRKLFSANGVPSLLRGRISVFLMHAEATNGKLAWRFVATSLTLLAFAAGAAAQTVVVGTGNPDVDVPAVQAAVDEGGQIVLKGRFSFNRPPTVPTDLPALPTPGGYPPATVLVSKAVTISGAQDEDGEMTSIEGGTIPF
jgi:hypothetical protein